MFQKVEIDQELLSFYSRYIGEYFDLSIFGVDYLQDREGRYYVVDINSFPGFKNCESIGSQMKSCLRTRHARQL